MLQVFLLVGLHSVVRCLIPDLSVQMLDHRLVERKRQDTLDMCRLFAAENEKRTPHHFIETPKNNTRKRSKRDNSIKPVNNEEENAKRVESIVDKLYDDLEEKGVQFTYRKRNLENSTLPDKVGKNLTMAMRRFNFAPAELLGPALTTENTMKKQHQQDETTSGNSAGNAGNVEWPKRWNYGIIPYFIDSKTYDTQLADAIMKAFEYFEKATCIRLQRLKDRPTDTDSLLKVEWLYITNPNGIRPCVHSNEKKTNKGVQVVVFGYDCMSLGEIVHEVMHILGFSHEHTRPDRDRFITIFWDNIKSGYKKYFETRSYDALMNIPYDYNSVLHYPPRAFSKNGQITVMSPPGTSLGQRDGLSEGDIEKIGIIYGNECVDRNRQYLLKTCPSVVKEDTGKQRVTSAEIDTYFKERLWPYGVVNYKLKDRLEFSAEERENIKAVIRHIEKETCIKFREDTINDSIEVDMNVDTEDDTSKNKLQNVSSEHKGFRDGQQVSGPTENAFIPQNIQESSSDLPVYSQDPQDIESSDTGSAGLSQDPQSAESNENAVLSDSQHTSSSDNAILAKDSEQETGSNDNAILSDSQQHMGSIDNAIISQQNTGEMSSSDIANLSQDTKETETASSDNAILSQDSEHSGSSENSIVSQDSHNAYISADAIISQNSQEGTDFSNETFFSQDLQETDSSDNIFLPQEDMGLSDNAILEQGASENDETPLEQEKSSESKELLSYKRKLRRQRTDSRQSQGRPKKLVKRSASITQAKPQRRHAEDFLILARSVEPGCTCPTPGKPGGTKVLYINADCFNSVNDLLHLFVHLLGLDHQHNMYDRDSYLHIIWDNLTPDVKEQMKTIYPPAASLGFDYDYQSVMHYPWLQIKNGVTNIMYPIWNDGWAMGHWQGLSSTDVKKLNLLYSVQCSKRN